MIIIGYGTSNKGFLRILQLVVRHGYSLVKHMTLPKIVNSIICYFEWRTGQSRLRSFPVEIQIDSSNICDLHCPLCPTGQKRSTRKAGTMTYELFVKIISELKPYLFKVRLYNWGEPFLNRDIYRMIRFLFNRNIGTEISSNLVNFDNSQSEELVRSGLEYLIVSLDGADAATYEMYRLGGKFDLVIDNIRHIVAAKKSLHSGTPKVELQYLVMSHNEHSIDAMCRLARSLDVDLLRFGSVTINIRNKEDFKWLPKNQNFSRYDLNDHTDRIYNKGKRCQMPWRTAVINWDGTVSPCCIYEGMKCEAGSIVNESFSSVWNNEYFIHCREEFGTQKRNAYIHKTICQICKGVPFALDRNQNGLF